MEGMGLRFLCLLEEKVCTGGNKCDAVHLKAIHFKTIRGYNTRNNSS